MSTTITIKRGEGKWLQFNVTRDGSLLDVSSATFSFVVKESYDDTTYVIEKTDSDFDKTLGSVGVVRVNLSTTNTDIANGRYKAELRMIITASTDVDKSEEYAFVVEKTLFN